MSCRLADRLLQRTSGKRRDRHQIELDKRPDRTDHQLSVEVGADRHDDVQLRIEPPLLDDGIEEASADVQYRFVRSVCERGCNPERLLQLVDDQHPCVIGAGCPIESFEDWPEFVARAHDLDRALGPPVEPRFSDSREHAREHERRLARTRRTDHRRYPSASQLFHDELDFAIPADEGVALVSAVRPHAGVRTRWGTAESRRGNVECATDRLQ